MAGSISIQSLSASPRTLPPEKSSSLPLRFSIPLSFLENKNHGSCLKLRNGKRRTCRKYRAVVSQASQGPSAAYAKEMERLAAKESLLLAVESNFILNSKLSVEGPLRMREEYIEGIFESPKIKEESIPQQLKGAFDQANSTVQQLPVSIRDAAMSGFKVPLGRTFQRLFLISYLDDEIMIARSTAGVPEVLTRLYPGPSVVLKPITEYES